jgi:hypothetical protein
MVRAGGQQGVRPFVRKPLFNILERRNAAHKACSRCSPLAQNHNAAWREDALRKRPISAGGGKWKNNFTTHRSPAWGSYQLARGPLRELRSQEAAKTGRLHFYLIKFLQRTRRRSLLFLHSCGSSGHCHQRRCDIIIYASTPSRRQ